MPSRRETYDPFKDPDIHLRPAPPEADEPEADSSPWPEYPRQRLAPRPGQRLDWGEVARQIALGRAAEEIARDFHCRPDRIWRNMKRSKRFRARIELELDRLKLQTSLQFRNLAGHTVHQLKRRTEKLDARTLLWLAERLRLGGRPLKADALSHWLASVATLQIVDVPPPKPEPEEPLVIGSKEEFREELRLAEEIGSDKLIEGVLRAERSRLDVNHQLRKSFWIEQEAAEKRVDI